MAARGSGRAPWRWLAGRAAGEDHGRLGAGLRREALLEQVLRLLRLDARYREVVLERAAADVSRATVFTYFPSKEDIVFGDAPAAVEALAEALRDRPVIPAVRAWLGGLAGWIEPDLVLQLRLVREVPGVGARRLQIYGDLERVLADALEAELGERLPAELAAASLLAGLRIVEDSAAARMEAAGELTQGAIEGLIDDAVRFAEAGIAAVSRAP